MHTYPAVSLTPGSWSLAAGTSKTHRRRWLDDGIHLAQTNLSGGAITPTGGVYTAGSTKGVVDVIGSATLWAPPQPPPHRSTPQSRSHRPSSSPTVRPRAAQCLRGGTGTGYTWNKLTSCSGFTLDADGTYYPGSLAAASMSLA